MVNLLAGTAKILPVKVDKQVGFNFKLTDKEDGTFNVQVNLVESKAVKLAVGCPFLGPVDAGFEASYKVSIYDIMCPS